MKDYPQYFICQSVDDVMVSVRDFQTTGVVAFARGCPFFNMKTGNLTLQGKRVQVTQERLDLMSDAIQAVVDKIK